MSFDASKLPKKMQLKWGRTVLQSQWTNVPNLLLEHQKNLDLSSTELVMLINLMSYEHDVDTDIYPSISTLAKRQGLHERSTQRAINRLIEKGMLEKHIRSKHQNQAGLTNIYSLEPLKNKLMELALKLQK